MYKSCLFFLFFRAARPCCKNAAKMTSQRLSGTLPGTLWDPPGTPWEAQEAPRATQEGPRSRPGPPRSLSKRAPGRLWKQVRRPRAAQRPPGSHLGAILVDFEAFLLVFSTPRRLILNRSGDMFPICLLAVFRKFWTLPGSIFQPLGVQFLEPVRTRFRMIQGVGLQRKFGKPRDDPHSNRPSARA